MYLVLCTLYIKMIPKDTITNIMQTAQIEEVIGDFLSLKKKGNDYWANCPFHNEKSPSFSVSPVKGIFKCFGCGEGGNSVDFLIKHEHITYPEALRYLAKKYQIEIVEKEQTPEQIQAQTEKESLYIVSQFAQEFFAEQLHQTDEGKSIGLGYFKERGFSLETIHKFGLGYSPETWGAFTEKALAKGYQLKYLLQLGLSKEKNGNYYDGYRGRVIFPIQNVSGRTIGFGARILTNDKKQPKYINSPESEIYEKSKVLYGLNQAKKAISQQVNCYLVEGYTDVISLHQAGVENVVASSGTSLTKEQVKLIKRYSHKVTILYDGDFAGIKASFRGIDLILEEGLDVKVVLFPEGEDPDSYSRKLPNSDFKEYIEQQAQDFIFFKASVLKKDAGNDPFKRSELVRNILESIAIVPDQITRALYVRETANLIEVEERILQIELNKLRRKSSLDRSSDLKDQYDQLQEAQVLPPAPDQREKAPTLLSSSFFEKDLVRLMLNYIDKSISFKTETGEHEMGLVAFILTEIKRDQLTFQSPSYQKLFSIFQEHEKDVEPLKLEYFYHHEDEDIRKTAIELTAKKYELSQWDRRQIIVNTEEMLLKRAATESVYAFKAFKIDEMIHVLEEQLPSKSAEEIGPVLQKLGILKELRRKLKMEIGRPI